MYDIYEPLKRGIAVCFAPDEILNYDSVREKLDFRERRGQGDYLVIKLAANKFSKRLVKLEVTFENPRSSSSRTNFGLSASFAK